jgi:hypothetical protein
MALKIHAANVMSEFWNAIETEDIEFSIVVYHNVIADYVWGEGLTMGLFSQWGPPCEVGANSMTQIPGTALFEVLNQWKELLDFSSL